MSVYRGYSVLFIVNVYTYSLFCRISQTILQRVSAQIDIINNKLVKVIIIRIGHNLHILQIMNMYDNIFAFYLGGARRFIDRECWRRGIDIFYMNQNSMSKFETVEMCETGKT